jgi:hypothetical protein
MCLKLFQKGERWGDGYIVTSLIQLHVGVGFSSDKSCDAIGEGSDEERCGAVLHVFILLYYASYIF